MRRLKSLTVEGFKSIKSDTIELGALNVLIGGNGVGKSNWISVFKFLREIYYKNLQIYVGVSGADALLHFGRKTSSEIKISAIFERTDAPFENSYEIALIPTDADSLIFKHEKSGFRNTYTYPNPEEVYWKPVWTGHSESQLSQAKTEVAATTADDVASYSIYHFHDTSAAAPVKQTQDIENNKFLYADASNLAPFLYWMKQQHADRFEAVQDVVRQISPFFHQFELSPSKLNPEKIRLEWREKGFEQNFGPQQLSDGTLRFMCLATLLLQPEIPRMVLLDEPELGLHPAAIILLAELLKEAARRTQLLVATQSVTLVNQLEQNCVYVADRIDGATKIRALEKEDLSHWLNRYALGELWEKNVIGGRP